jgi:hypothetical protein
MRFRAKIVPLLLAGASAVGCDNTDASKAVAKTDTPGKKEDPKVETKAETKPETKEDPKPTIVIEKPEDIPVALGGAPMPYEPPPPPRDPKAPSAPAPAPSPSPAAAAPSASAAAAPATARPTAIALQHNHPPGEACKPLTREEVETALADLKK